nr:MAG TPA: hypothetical protein [Caudoviricetes sp.]
MNVDIYILQYIYFSYILYHVYIKKEGVSKRTHPLYIY